jgi:hypothetical protein
MKGFTYKKNDILILLFNQFTANSLYLIHRSKQNINTAVKNLNKY